MLEAQAGFLQAGSLSHTTYSILGFIKALYKIGLFKKEKNETGRKSSFDCAFYCPYVINYEPQWPLNSLAELTMSLSVFLLDPCRRG